MKREYSFKDARKTVKDFNYVLKELVKIEGIVETYKTNLIAKAEEMLELGFFEKKLMADLESGQVSDVNYEECYELISLMYGYFVTSGVLEECLRLHLENSDYVKEQVLTLSKYNNAVSWLFANEYKKQKAISSYDALKDESVQYFYTAATEILTKLQGLVTVTKEQVLEDVKSNEEKYKTLLFELKPFIIGIGKKAYGIENLRYEFSNFTGDFERQDYQIERAKKDVKDAVEDQQEQELREMLRKLPLEELNRDKHKINISALKKFGYTSMEHLYKKPARYLKTLPGIGDQGAILINAITTKLVKDTKAYLKLSLSADNKSFFATKLVYEIYVYREKKRLILEDREKLCAEYIEQIERAFNALGDVENGIKYYFISKEEKQKYYDKYLWLRKNLKEEGFATGVKELKTKFKQAEKVSKFECWGDFVKDTTPYYAVIEELCPGVLGNDDYYYGLPESLAKEILDEPLYLDGLRCTLRHYQEVGAKYILHQKKVLLGDEMGLGKTVQAIASMVSLRNMGATHFLVVCPASVVANWCREIKKHSDLEPIKVHGNSKEKAVENWVQNGGVAVTTFETTDNIILEEGFKYSMMVVDEAHYIKNPEAQRTEYTIRLSRQAERILFMTGTALENKVDEMLRLIGVLNSNVYQEVSRMAYMSTAPEFKEKVAPVYYRRKRDEVLTELPEKIEYKDWCTMTPEEEKVYEDTVLNGSYPAARRVSWHIDDLKHSSKANRLLEIVESAKEENRKIIIFSFFLDTIDKLSKLLEKECIGIITGAIDSEKRQAIIDKLATAPAGGVILAQITAGGTGLNIQSASVVVICEPQFKPSTENQAISRAYRMGQSRTVLVHRLLCEDTIDERITNLLEEKQKVFDTFADKSVANEKTLEVEEEAFTNIMKDEAEKIKEKREGK